MPELADRDGRLLAAGDHVVVQGERTGRFAGAKVETFGFVATVEFDDGVSRFYVDPSHTPYRCPDLRRDAPIAPDEAPFRWTVTVKVERLGCPDATREVVVDGDVLAAPGKGKVFGVAAIARAMHLSSQKVSARVREMKSEGAGG